MYYEGQSPAEPQRPGVVMAGVVTVFTTVILALGTALALLMSYRWVSNQTLTDSATDQELFGYLKSYMVMVIAFYAIISLTLAIGAVMVLRQQNAGRVMIWIAGGILATTNLCCGSMFALIVSAINESTSSYNSTGTTDAPTTELTLASVFALAAVVASIVAMILIAQGSVSRWIKGTPATPVTGYMPGSPVAYPQPQQYIAPPPPPQQQPQYPPQQQYGPGSYGDQYGPGQQPYNGGDQYGPGPTSGPPSGY